MANDLEPCPFCGSPKIKSVHGSEVPGADEDVFWKQCERCGATGPTGYRRQDEDKPVWNTRSDAAITRLTEEVAQWTVNSRENKMIAESADRRAEAAEARVAALEAELAAYQAPGGWHPLYMADARRITGDPTIGVSLEIPLAQAGSKP